MENLFELVKASAGTMGMGDSTSRANQGASKPIAPVQPMGAPAVSPGQFKPSPLLSVASITNQQQQMPEVMNQQLTPQAPGPGPLDSLPSPGQPREGSPPPGSSQPKMAMDWGPNDMTDPRILDLRQAQNGGRRPRNQNAQVNQPDNSPASRLNRLAGMGGVQPPRPMRQVPGQRFQRIQRQEPVPTTPQQLMQIQFRERQQLISDAYRKGIPPEQVKQKLADLDAKHKADQARMTEFHNIAVNKPAQPIQPAGVGESVQKAQQYQAHMDQHQQYDSAQDKLIADAQKRMADPSTDAATKAKLQQDIQKYTSNKQQNQSNMQATNAHWTTQLASDPVAQAHYQRITKLNELNKERAALTAPGAVPNPMRLAELDKQVSAIHSDANQVFNPSPQPPAGQPAGTAQAPAAQPQSTTTATVQPPTPQPPAQPPAVQPVVQPPAAQPAVAPHIQPPTISPSSSSLSKPAPGTTSPTTAKIPGLPKPPAPPAPPASSATET